MKSAPPFFGSPRRVRVETVDAIAEVWWCDETCLVSEWCYAQLLAAAEEAQLLSM